VDVTVVCAVADDIGQPWLHIEQILHGILLNAIAIAIISVSGAAQRAQPIGAIPGVGVDPIAGQVAVEVVGEGRAADLIRAVVGEGHRRAVDRLAQAVPGQVEGVGVGAVGRGSKIIACVVIFFNFLLNQNIKFVRINST